MATEKDLHQLMTARPRVWSPAELCEALNVHIVELVRLVAKARKKGVQIRVEQGEHTANTSKILLDEIGLPA
ncbi:hypothetical protein VA7868_03727 [Vibrio aerogenes CECT 7868]|uniref:Uncharacterized protein n=1 Tax=Vibrio aerogenes CECT 7868 TaxID=1216006 RepID=A0A1M6B727_9VIBR|nr:hypothetical protein [Vibrio aerogenes]SHI44549.1 hypothetical protein VA7868_03727 [Vibrio aerogenes CECT 7868]